jgi:peptidase E
MKILLTSAGFTNKTIGQRFIELLPKPLDQVRILFLPTAAIEDEAKYYVQKCLEELLEVGIQQGNITVYDFEYEMTSDQALEYDVLYFPGGNTAHLLSRIRETGFDQVIVEMVEADKVYVGVSAGSLVMTAKKSYDHPIDLGTAGLVYLNAYLAVHCNEPDQAWADQTQSRLPLPLITLNDMQAVLLDENGYAVIE